MSESEIPLRLLSRIKIGGEPTWNGSSCWVWTRGRLKSGYGMVCYQGKTQLAHRLSYRLFRRPIPDGLQLDHLCRNRSCINPDHLEPVTAHTNTMRGDGVAAHNASRTHCKRGHEFTPENTYAEPSSGRRVCRTCSSAWRRAKRLGLHVDEVVAGDIRQRKPKKNSRQPNHSDVRRRMEALGES